MNNISIEGFSLSELLSIFDAKVDSNDFYDCLAQEIVKLDEHHLISRFNGFSDMQKRGIIFGLSSFDQISSSSKVFLKEVALDATENSLVRADSLRALITLEVEISWSEFEVLLDHDSEHIRASTLLLGSYCLPDVGSIFRRFIKDKSSIVRETIIDEIDDKSYKDLWDIVKPCLQDEAENVRQAASYLLDCQRN